MLRFRESENVGHVETVRIWAFEASKRMNSEATDSDRNKNLCPAPRQPPLRITRKCLVLAQRHGMVWHTCEDRRAEQGITDEKCGASQPGRFFGGDPGGMGPTGAPSGKNGKARRGPLPSALSVAQRRRKTFRIFPCKFLSQKRAIG